MYVINLTHLHTLNHMLHVYP